MLTEATAIRYTERKNVDEKLELMTTTGAALDEHLTWRAGYWQTAEGASLPGSGSENFVSIGRGHASPLFLYPTIQSQMDVHLRIAAL